MHQGYQVCFPKLPLKNSKDLEETRAYLSRRGLCNYYDEPLKIAY